MTDSIQISGNVYARRNLTHSFNGDGSEFEVCRYSSGSQSLFEDSDALGQGLDERLGIDLDAICDGEVAEVRNSQDLRELIEERALQVPRYRGRDAFGDNFLCVPGHCSTD